MFGFKSRLDRRIEELIDEFHQEAQEIRKNIVPEKEPIVHTLKNDNRLFQVRKRHLRLIAMKFFGF